MGNDDALTERYVSSPPNEESGTVRLESQQDSSLSMETRFARAEEFGLLLEQALRKPSGGMLDPKSIGPFPIVERLGEGGCGVVFLATDPHLRRNVAIKVPHGRMLIRSGEQNRFLQEARLVATVKHPQIVEIYQVGEDAAVPYLVFEYCAGGSLADWLSKRGAPVSPRASARIILSLARALHFAHQCAVVHRDVNPRNVLLVPRTEPNAAGEADQIPFEAKLSDFGLGTWLDERMTAVQTQPGAVLGTVAYMAPEQTRADVSGLTPCVDIYGLGVVLYELLTGERPFSAATTLEILQLVRDADPVPPRGVNAVLPRDIETICLKCLEKNPERRYETAAALADDLDRFLLGAPILARPIGRVGRIWRWIERHRWRAGSITIIILALATILFGRSMLLKELTVSRESEGRLKQQLDRGSESLNEAQAKTSELKRIAIKEAEAARRSSYADSIQLGAALVATRPIDAIQILRRWIPAENETDLRGFEWYYLMQACGGDIVRVAAVDAPNNYSGIRLSANGERLFLADERCIRVWNTQTFQVQDSFPHPEGIVEDFCLSPVHGRLIHSAPRQPFVDVRDCLTNAPLRHIPSPTTGLGHCCRLRIDSKRQQVVCLWTQQVHSPPCAIGRIDLVADVQQPSLSIPDRRVLDIAVDSDNDQIIVAFESTIGVYNRSAQKVQELDFDGRGILRSIDLSADMQRLVIATDLKQILICEKNSEGQWKSVAEFPTEVHSEWLNDPHGEIFHDTIRFDPSGRRLYFPSGNAMVYAEMTSDYQLKELVKVTGASPRRFELGPGSECVTWISLRECGIWRPTRRLNEISGHERECWCVTYSHPGGLLATGSDDETVIVWDARTGKRLGELRGHEATITKTAFSPNDSLLASASLDGTVRIWDPARFELIRTLRTRLTQVRALRWFGDGVRLATGDSPHSSTDHHVVIWNTQTGEVQHRLTGFRDRIAEILISNDQKKLIAVTDDMLIHRYDFDASNNTWVRTEPLLNNSSIRCAVLFDTEKKLATGDNNGVIRTWDLDTGRMTNELIGHSSHVLTLAVSSDGRLLASGGKDKAINLWELETGRRMLALENQSAQVNGLAFSPAQDVLAAALHDGSVKQFHAPRFKPLPSPR